jgi:hypothetical protein
MSYTFIDRSVVDDGTIPYTIVELIAKMMACQRNGRKEIFNI